MPTFNSLISRTDAAALMPEDAATEVIESTIHQSILMQVARRLPDMPRQVRRLPVLDVLPTAYFVGNKGDGGASSFGALKQTSEANWASVYLYAEELAVIVPIPENVLDDADYDVWASITPRLSEAFGRAIDAAMLHGLNKPSDWPSAIYTGANAASHVIDYSTQLAAGQDLYDMLLAESGVFGLVEEDGYDVTGVVAAQKIRARLRGTRSADGEPIFQRDVAMAQQYSLDGRPIYFPMNGSFNATNNTNDNLLFAGDWSQLLWAMRKDISIKILTEGVISNDSGVIVYNLPQEDMVALRATMRLGFALPNPTNAENSNASTRYPFAVLKQ